jgi:hypothetical protein
VQRTEKRTERSNLPGIIITRLVLYVNGLSQDADFGTYKCVALRKGVLGEKPKMDIVILNKGGLLFIYLIDYHPFNII